MLALISVRSFENIEVIVLTLWEGLLKYSNSVSAGRCEPIIHAVPSPKGRL
jgi:hypothetical protein